MSGISRGGQGNLSAQEIDTIGNKILNDVNLPPHEILDVKKDASDEAIIKAAKKMLFAFHPDRYAFYKNGRDDKEVLTKDAFEEICRKIEAARSTMLEQQDAQDVDAYTMEVNEFNELLKKAIVVTISENPKGLNIEVDLKLLKFPEHEIAEKLANIDAWINSTFKMDSTAQLSVITPSTFELATFVENPKLVRIVPIEKVLAFFQDEQKIEIEDGKRYIVGWILGMKVGDFVNERHRQEAHKAAEELKAAFMAQSNSESKSDGGSSQNHQSGYFSFQEEDPIDMRNFFAHISSTSTPNSSDSSDHDEGSGDRLDPNEDAHKKGDGPHRRA